MRRRGDTVRLAAKGAEAAYAFVEAANLYSRALEAGGKLPELSKIELGRVQEALADAWFHAGEYRKALDAYTSAQAQVAGEKLLEANLLIKLSRVEEKLGQYPEALRWVERAREALADAQGIEAARQNAMAAVWYATVLQAQGSTAEALKWAEQAAHEGEELDDPEVTGDAYMVMGWGYSVLGREGGEAMMLKSLEAHQRSGNRVRQASILSNLGSACYWDGRMDDAMSYFERGRDELVKVGSRLNAAVASIGHRRNPERSRRVRRGGIDASAKRARLQGGRVSLLPRLCDLDAGACIACAQARSTRRYPASTRRGSC